MTGFTARPRQALGLVFFGMLVVGSADLSAGDPVVPAEAVPSGLPVADHALRPGVDPDWRDAVALGQHDLAVKLARDGSEAEPLARLLVASDTLDLHEEPMWRALLHYQATRFGGVSSRIDAPYFFLSENGKRSPKAELDATIAAMFADVSSGPRRLPARCRFVARRAWLLESLGDDAGLLPEADCPEFDQFQRYLAAHSLTLVFPGAYPSSPSSAFGHTLLRIDKEGQGPESRLLNMSVNFAADVPPDADGTALYALKGLTGSYPGRYRLLPYHVKLREYAQIENRDVWEYELDIPPVAVGRVLAHGYELLIAYHDYFYLSENCSYQLLAMLNVAFPEEPLTDEFGLWTIPVDTIKLLRERGLVRQTRWEASTVNQLRAREASLTPSESKRVFAVIDGADAATTLAPVAPERRAELLDLLIEHARFERVEADGGSVSPSDNERLLLGMRSKLVFRSGTPLIDPPEPADIGHGSARVTLAVDRLEQTSIGELGLRPAYHDLRDPSLGYGSRATIDFFGITLATDTELDKAFLREFVLLGIESIEPATRLVQPVSWRTRLAWRRERPSEPHRAAFEVGAGLAYQLGAEAPVVFGFLESAVTDDSAFEDRLGLALGARVGLHWDAVPGLRFGFEAKHLESVGLDHGRSSAVLWASRAFGSDTAIVFDAEYRDLRDRPRERRAKLELRRYF